MWEGCLSVPGLRGWVERPREIRMKGLNEHGESHGFSSKTVGVDGDTMKIGRIYFIIHIYIYLYIYISIERK